MPFHGTKVLRHIHAHMGYNQKMVQVSADNLARHAVPGAKAKVLAPYSFNGYVGSNPSALHITNSRHIPITKAYGQVKISTPKGNGEINANGNNIVPEQQLQQMNEATLQINEDIKSYQSIMDTYRSFTMMGK